MRSPRTSSPTTRANGRSASGMPASIERFSFDNMLLEAEQPLFVQIDGELLSLNDPKRLEFEIIPEAIQFRLPN